LNPVPVVPPFETSSAARLLAAVLGMWLATVAASSAAADDAPRLEIVPEPPVIAPADAAQHVGEVVVLELSIAEATATGGRVVLRAAAPDLDRVRVVIVAPMIGESARQIAARYAGRQVRAIGRLQEFDGRYEIVTADADRVVVVGTELAQAPPAHSAPPVAIPDSEPTPHAAATASPEPTASPAVATTTVLDSAPASAPVPAPVPAAAPERAAAPEPAAPPEPPAALVPATAPEPAAAPVPATTPVPEAADAPTSIGARQPEATPNAACREARQRWQSAADTGRAATAALGACLAAGPPCADELDRVRSTMAEIAAQEERIRWLCDGSP